MASWTTVNTASAMACHLFATEPLHQSMMTSCYIDNCKHNSVKFQHYDDVIIGAIASQITSFTIVYSTIYSDADQRKYQSSASLAFVRRIHRGPVNSPHKWPVTLKMFPFDGVIMIKIYQFSQKNMKLKLLAAKWLYLTLPQPEGGKEM